MTRCWMIAALATAFVGCGHGGPACALSAEGMGDLQERLQRRRLGPEVTLLVEGAARGGLEGAWSRPRLGPERRRWSRPWTDDYAVWLLARWSVEPSAGLESGLRDARRAAARDRGRGACAPEVRHGN